MTWNPRSGSKIASEHNLYYNNGIHLRGKKIRLLYCGDYEVLTRSYGISGASGKCLHNTMHIMQAIILHFFLRQALLLVV